MAQEEAISTENEPLPVKGSSRAYHRALCRVFWPGSISDSPPAGGIRLRTWYCGFASLIWPALRTVFDPFAEQFELLDQEGQRLTRLRIDVSDSPQLGGILRFCFC
ncbi:MAG: hypothetical protein GVY10_03140 [Verrucomicrobia bacterium]|nr:hypothetical protein [Verrucomicrobiota bacterium]